MEIESRQTKAAQTQLRCRTHATSILPSGRLVAPRTLVLSLNLRPCFCRMRWKFLDISMSMPIPPTWPKNSTAVTLEPSRCHTDPCRRGGQRGALLRKIQKGSTNLWCTLKNKENQDGGFLSPGQQRGEDACGTV